MAIDFESAFQDLAEKYGRFPGNAYRFTYDAVEYTVQRLGEVRHITGGELLTGIRDLARQRFGPMAKTVFEQWRITRTEDFGDIVFQLVDQGLLGKTDRDRQSDFAQGFDFDDAFVRDFDWLDRIEPPHGETG